jgi:hypothetical protein
VLLTLLDAGFDDARLRASSARLLGGRGRRAEVLHLHFPILADLLGDKEASGTLENIWQ